MYAGLQIQIQIYQPSPNAERREALRACIGQTFPTLLGLLRDWPCEGVPTPELPSVRLPSAASSAFAFSKALKMLTSTPLKLTNLAAALASRTGCTLVALECVLHLV